MAKQITRTAVIRRIKSRLKAGQGFEYDRAADKWFITHGSDIIEEGLTVEIMVERLNVLKAWEEIEPMEKPVKKSAERPVKQKPAGKNPADDDFSGDLNAYVGKYPPGQVKRGDE